MSVYAYDTSIIDKLREITGDDRVSIVPTDNLFNFIANLKEDNIKFPLISLSRRGYTLRSNSRSPLSSQGLKIKCDHEGIHEIQAVPIQIEYQLDILTRKRNDNDEITAEILFWFINHPTLTVSINKGDGNKEHVFSMFFNEDIEDNSEIESHMRNGEYFRSTLTFYVPDAYLWNITKRPALKMGSINFIATTDMNDDSKDYINEEVDINNNK